MTNHVTNNFHAGSKSVHIYAPAGTTPNAPACEVLQPADQAPRLTTGQRAEAFASGAGELAVMLWPHVRRGAVKGAHWLLHALGYTRWLVMDVIMWNSVHVTVTLLAATTSGAKRWMDNKARMLPPSRLLSPWVQRETRADRLIGPGDNDNGDR